ncbi:MAG TPA: ABC transporter permease [Kofleriaceae bacterium]|nr:ABC transporter permease [Kofleriaceae bacterium]
MCAAATAIERQGKTAIVRVRGDVVIPTARALHSTLKGLQKRRDVKKVVLDFTEVGKLDSSAIAVVEIAKRSLHRWGKELELDKLDEHHRAAFELAPKQKAKPLPHEPGPSWLESIGGHVLAIGGTARELGALIGDSARQTIAVLARRRKLPAGSVGNHVLLMGADAVFIVGLLSFLIGMTMAFQGVVQLEKFGAGVFVADMVGWSMVREFAPLMTAVILTGRTGAAIAAELGTMRVNLEIDALTAMGINPVRFLVVPRLTALTFVLPALTLMGMFIGITAGMLVTSLMIDMSPITFWVHVQQRVTLTDFAYGLGKSFVFAAIIGFSGSHLGMRANGDASSVGRATTKAVVVSVFLIIVVDAIFATLSSIAKAH